MTLEGLESPRRMLAIVYSIICSALFASSSALANTVVTSQTFINVENYTINRHNDAHYNGATINLWAENNNASQNWVWDNGKIRSASNRDFCLNIHNYALQDGAVINLWRCNGHASQQWIKMNNTIRPQGNTNFCLNLHGYQNANGATINLWTCNGHLSQHWDTVYHTSSSW